VSVHDGRDVGLEIAIDAEHGLRVQGQGRHFCQTFVVDCTMTIKHRQYPTSSGSDYVLWTCPLALFDTRDTGLNLGLVLLRWHIIVRPIRILSTLQSASRACARESPSTSKLHPSASSSLCGGFIRMLRHVNKCHCNFFAFLQCAVGD
jgi:hypothetical protein